MQKRTLIIIALVLLPLFFFLGIKAGEIYSGNIIGGGAAQGLNSAAVRRPLPETLEAGEEGSALTSLNLVVLGDITAHVIQINQALQDDGSYDFSPSFEVIAPYLQAADLTVGDLETAQAGPDISFLGYSGYTGYPQFNAPRALSVALRDAGFDLLTMANNHTLDRGLEGLKSSLDHLRGLGIETFGAYKSREERDTPLVVEREGIRIAFIAYTYNTNGLPVPEGHEYCVNLVPDFEDISPLLDDINRARDNGADLVAVFPHWGEMYVHEPQPQRLRQAAAEMAAAGADLIMGGHPHYIQPIEWFFNANEDGTQRATLAVYSLGNFISNQSYRHFPLNPSPFVEYGLLLDIELTKNMNTGEAWISGADYDITWVHLDWRHRILPLSEVLSGSPGDYNLTVPMFEELETYYRRNIDVVETYGHTADKVRAMAIAASLAGRAHGGNDL